MKLCSLLLFLSFGSLCAFTLDTNTAPPLKEKPKTFPLWFQSDAKAYYDSSNVRIRGVVVDTLQVDFNVTFTCSNTHTVHELKERQDELSVILRKMMLSAEAEGFSITPYEKELQKKVNQILVKGRVIKLSLIQENIY